MCVEHDRARPLAFRVGARGDHECRGGGGSLAPGADRSVFQVIRVDGAGRREELQQRLAHRADAQPGNQIGDRKRAQLGRRVVDELPAGGHLRRR